MKLFSTKLILKVLPIVLGSLTVFVSVLIYLKRPDYEIAYEDGAKLEVKYRPSDTRVRITNPKNGQSFSVGTVVSLKATVHISKAEVVLRNKGKLPTKDLTLSLKTSDSEPEILPPTLTETVVQGQNKFITFKTPIAPEYQTLLVFSDEPQMLWISNADGDQTPIDTNKLKRKISSVTSVKFSANGVSIGSASIMPDGAPLLAKPR